MTITKNIAKHLIYKTSGKIFNAIFVKKNGELREMTCRLGVTKHLKGGERAYNPSDYDLVCVFDMQAEGYRSINLNTLQTLTIGGNQYSIV